MSEDLNRPFSHYLMGALEYSRFLRRQGDPTGALLELYELIPDLEPEIQTKLAPIEKKIEEVRNKVGSKIRDGSEFQQAIDYNQAVSRESENLLREARREIMSECHKAGYFIFEKQGGGFYNPSQGRSAGDRPSLGLQGTVRRTV